MARIVALLLCSLVAVAFANASLLRSGRAQQAKPSDRTTISRHKKNGKITFGGNLGKDADYTLLVPPRYMWGWGPGLRGYCGETSFQSHGIYYGNWLSSEEVRYSAGGKELLIGVNDEGAAKDLHYTYETFKGQRKDYSASTFIPWLRQKIDNGHLVVTGLYEELPEGDADYDHIIPIVGYRYATTSGEVKDVFASQTKGTKEKLAVREADLVPRKSNSQNASASDYGGMLGFFFNDLWSEKARYIHLSERVTTRKGCERGSWPVQPYDYCLPKNYVYAIALTGIKDDYQQTVRMSLAMPDWNEPDWGKEDKLHQKIVDFNISAVITQVEEGHEYQIVRFDDRDSVPSRDFLDGSYSKSWKFTATLTGIQVLEGFDLIPSDGTFFYRCVEVNPSKTPKGN